MYSMCLHICGLCWVNWCFVSCVRPAQSHIVSREENYFRACLNEQKVTAARYLDSTQKDYNLTPALQYKWRPWMKYLSHTRIHPTQLQCVTGILKIVFIYCWTESQSRGAAGHEMKKHHNPCFLQKTNTMKYVSEPLNTQLKLPNARKENSLQPNNKQLTFRPVTCWHFYGIKRDFSRGGWIP